MSQYFPKPFNSHFGDSIKVKIDLSNYATKTDIKNISPVDISSFFIFILFITSVILVQHECESNRIS